MSPTQVASKEARVWVLNNSGHDMSDATKYTKHDFIVLTEGPTNVFQVDRLCYDFTSKLEQFKPDDYLLLSGSPVLAAIAVGILMRKYNYGAINLLVYNNKYYRYVPRRIVITNTGNGVASKG